MRTTKRALLLVGSPKGLARSLGSRRGAVILDALQDRGAEVQKMHILPAVSSAAGKRALLDAVQRADKILLAAPLYVDSLPAPVITAFETLSESRAEIRDDKQMLALLNCGYPEASQNAVAVQICQSFAQAMGWAWAGGIAIGGAGFRGDAMQRIAARVADALLQEEPVPEEIIRLAAAPAMPTWLYVLGGNLMWRRQARGNGVRRRLRARPYVKLDDR